MRCITSGGHSFFSLDARCSQTPRFAIDRSSQICASRRVISVVSADSGSEAFTCGHMCATYCMYGDLKRSGAVGWVCAQKRKRVKRLLARRMEPCELALRRRRGGPSSAASSATPGSAASLSPAMPSLSPTSPASRAESSRIIASSCSIVPACSRASPQIVPFSPVASPNTPGFTPFATSSTSAASGACSVRAASSEEPTSAEDSRGGSSSRLTATSACSTKSEVNASASSEDMRPRAPTAAVPVSSHDVHARRFLTDAKQKVRTCARRKCDSKYCCVLTAKKAS